MQTFCTSDVSGVGGRRSRVHTSWDALSLPCSLVSVCPGKQNRGDLFRRLRRLPKEARPFALLYFSGGKVVTSPWWFSHSARGLTVAPPLPTRGSGGRRLTIISENRPPWRRRDPQSAVLQSQVFQPCNRRRLLHSAEKVLTAYLLFLQTETTCGGGRGAGGARKRCFFVHEGITANILACGRRL